MLESAIVKRTCKFYIMMNSQQSASLKLYRNSMQYTSCQLSLFLASDFEIHSKLNWMGSTNSPRLNLASINRFTIKMQSSPIAAMSTHLFSAIIPRLISVKIIAMPLNRQSRSAHNPFSSRYMWRSRCRHQTQLSKGLGAAVRKGSKYLQQSLWRESHWWMRMQLLSSSGKPSTQASSRQLKSYSSSPGKLRISS